MKFLLKMLMYSCLAFPAYAKTIQQTHPRFPIDTDKLLQGEVHVFVDVVEPHLLKDKYPLFHEFDAFNLDDRDNVRLVVTKAAYVVDKPVGFFSERQLVEEKWLKHIGAGTSFKRKDDTTLQVKNRDGQYLLEVFYDSDDLSNVQRSRLMRAVAHSKSIDALSGGSYATACTISSKSSTERQGEIALTNYISLTTKKTAVITYKITALAKWKDKSLGEKVRGDFIKEIPALVQRTNSFN